MYKSILLICLVFFIGSLQSQSNTDSLILDRLKSLETREHLEAGEHQLRTKELNFAAEKALVQQKNTLFWWFVGFLGVGTIAGILTSIFWLPNAIRGKVEKEVDERIGEAIQGKSSTIRGMLKKYDYEDGLLMTKKIHFYQGKSSESFKDFLISLGFREQSFVDNVSQSDIVFINNEDAFLPGIDLRRKTAAEIKELLKEHSDWKAVQTMINSYKTKCFFYYNAKGMLFPSAMFSDLETLARINFATNPAQVYGNLLNTLKYQDKIA